jgi:hypothetical protein
MEMSYAYRIDPQHVRMVLPKIDDGWIVCPIEECKLPADDLVFPVLVGDEDSLYLSADNHIACAGCELDTCIFELQEKGKGDGADA